MATKNSNNFFSFITGGNKKKKKIKTEEMEFVNKVEEELASQKKISEDYIREKNLRDLLSEIDVDPINCKLTPRLVEDLGIEPVIQHALHEWDTPLITPYDMKEIDECIKYCVNELKRSVEEGLNATAKWATIALAAATETLHIPITGNDQEYADSLMEERRKYARNMKLLVQNALECDYYNKELQESMSAYKRDKEKLDKTHKELQEKLKQQKYVDYIIQMRNNAHNPSAIQDDKVIEFRSELNRFGIDKMKILTDAIAINALMAKRDEYDLNLQQCRGYVRLYPRVTDPNLLAKNMAAAEEYRNELRRRLNSAKEGMAAITNHLSEMMNLGSHPLFLGMTADALDVVAEIKMLPIKEKERALEVKRERMKELEHEKNLKRLEKQIAEETLKLEEELAELEKEEEEDTETDSVTETATEEVPETEPAEEVIEEDDADMELIEDDD